MTPRPPANARRGWHWPQDHTNVVQTLRSKARGGIRNIRVPGNHDEVRRNDLGTHSGGKEVTRQADFVGMNGKQYMANNRDQIETVVMNAKWLAHFR